MNCSSCGASLPPGAAFCTTCGSPTPYNVGPPGSSPQFDPTVAVPPPYGAPASGQAEIDPAVVASPPPPPPAYGAPPYGAPPPPQNAYQANQYGPGWQPGAYGVPPQQPPKKRGRLGLILAIIGGVLLLLCIGLFVALYQIGKSTVSSVTATTTAASSTITGGSSSLDASATAAVATVTAVTNNTTPNTTQGGAPSGLTVDPNAASILTNPQMASAIDSNYKPTTLTSTFTVGQAIYATFNISSTSPDGYILGKWYGDGTYAFSSNILKKSAGDTTGYLAARYNRAISGSVELYWCTLKDCSDKKLADVLTFTVTAGSMHWNSQPVIASRDINRPD